MVSVDSSVSSYVVLVGISTKANNTKKQTMKFMSTVYRSSYVVLCSLSIRCQCVGFIVDCKLQDFVDSFNRQITLSKLNLERSHSWLADRLLYHHHRVSLEEVISSQILLGFYHTYHKVQLCVPGFPSKPIFPQ